MTVLVITAQLYLWYCSQFGIPFAFGISKLDGRSLETNKKKVPYTIHTIPSSTNKPRNEATSTKCTATTTNKTKKRTSSAPSQRWTRSHSAVSELDAKPAAKPRGATTSPWAAARESPPVPDRRCAERTFGSIGEMTPLWGMVR